MYFVYVGYVSADRYDASESPCYKLKQFHTAGCAEDFIKEFYENIHGECSQVICRVIYGTEMDVVPEETVVTFKLKDKQ